MKNIVLIFTILTTFMSSSQTESTFNISSTSKLHYKTFGKGKPILIINGGPGMNCEGFAFIAEELSKLNYKTIIYDQRGTGKSTLDKVNSSTITMDLMVNDIENLRKHLKIDKWTILGHSFGGILASYYTTKHPETIEKLIFSSSGGINMKFLSYISERMNNNLSKSEKDSLSIYQEKFDAGNHSKETLKSRAKYLSSAYVFNKNNAPIIAERLTQINFNINRLVIENLLKIKFDCSNSFHNFKKPVLVLQGKNDIISTETAKEVADAFPNSELILIENCGHYGWLDAKETYLSSIEKFLNK